MNGREIPGFYYDAVKKKYFTIQPNHLAPKASQYSRENVSKVRKEAAHLEAEQNRRYAENVQRVRRSSLSTSQHGLIARREVAQARRTVLDIEPRVVGAGFAYTESIWQGRSRLSAIAKSPLDGQYVLGADGAVYCLDGRTRSMARFGTVSAVTSMSTSNGLMVLTTGGRAFRPADIHFYLLPSEENKYKFLYFCHTNLDEHEVVNYSSAANPMQHGLFLIGSTAGAGVVTPEPPFTTSPAAIHTGSDVLAVDWLDSSTGVLGTRNGSVHLWDTRARGSAIRLHHGSCISKLKQLDQNVLIVAGIEHNLAMYDLRMPAIHSSPPRRDKRRHDGSNKKTYTSTPILHYPYSNEHTLNLGFCATRSAGGLVFTGDDQGYVNIFSLNYGSLLQRFKPSANSDRPDVTRNLLFEEDAAALVGTSGDALWRAEWMGGEGVE